MSRILVAYATNSGSTAEVAGAVAAELNQNGHTAEVKRIEDVITVKAYDAVVVGAPMIFGWHPAARRFVIKYQVELANKKVAYFACAMRLTQAPGAEIAPVPLTLDPSLAASPVKPGALSIKERFTTTGYYLRPMLKAAATIKPVNVAFFNGKLELFRLKWWQAAFVMIVVQGVPGDYRDWDAIKSWSKSISATL
jgi:menaquinone-dependent protoporphyrinogen IX oxidase